MIDVALIGPMVEDIRTLAKVNMLPDGHQRRSPSGRAFTPIPFAFVGPGHLQRPRHRGRGDYRDHFSGMRGALHALAHPDLPLLARLVKGDGNRRGDVLSYLFFDRSFVDRAITLGGKEPLLPVRPGEGADPGK
jgi:NTE family protein